MNLTAIKFAYIEMSSGNRLIISVIVGAICYLLFRYLIYSANKSYKEATEKKKVRGNWRESLEQQLKTS